ncbi:MAG: carboxypeptidase regulatory-like domain-containing protein [Bryobacterales bacterium]|nr:carboxypeptidase regulatory-like domain-containing protein [Bryobacterales bacterium]
MTWRARVLGLSLGIAFAWQLGAQIGQPSQPAMPASQLGIIKGSVLDADTGEPLADVVVHADTTKVTFLQGKFTLAPGESSDAFFTTGEDGRFVLRSVPPGVRTVTAVNPKGIFNQVQIRRQVAEGQTVEDCHLRVSNPAIVSGRVLDEKGEPMPGVQVHVVTTEYHAGAPRNYLRPGGFTDENGEYRMDSIKAGRPLRLMAYWVPASYNALSTSKAPAEPKLRRPAYSRVFYPDATSLDGATELKLRSGEERQGVDFIMRREPSRCIEGKFIAPSDVKAIRLMLGHAEPDYGGTRRGGSFGMSWGGLLEGDFRFRICQLAAGTYRLRAHNQAEGRSAGLSAYTSQLFTVADRDVSGLEIPLVAPHKLSVALEWAGAPPENPPADLVPISLEPLNRAFFMGEQRSGRVSVPGEAELAAVLADDYTVNVRLPTNDPRMLRSMPSAAPSQHALYVKDIRYGDQSAQFVPMRVDGQPADAKLQVFVGSDGGTVAARVSDAKGNPAGDAYVYLLPMDTTEKDLVADSLLIGQTDQYGVFTWQRNVPPGTYRAVATRKEFDYSPGAVNALWQARPSAPEFRVAPKGRAEVTIKPLDD